MSEKTRTVGKCNEYSAREDWKSNWLHWSDFLYNLINLINHNRPCHGFRPPFCWVGKEIKERLPSPIQILLKSAHGAESTVRFRRFLQVCVSKRYRSLEPIEVSVFSSRLVNISSIRWKSEQLWTKPAHLDSHVRSLSVAIFWTIVISLTICINVLPVPFPWVKLFSWPFWTFLLTPFRFHFKSSLCVHVHDLPWLFIWPCGSGFHQRKTDVNFFLVNLRVTACTLIYKFAIFGVIQLTPSTQLHFEQTCDGVTIATWRNFISCNSGLWILG